MDCGPASGIARAARNRPIRRSRERHATRPEERKRDTGEYMAMPARRKTPSQTRHSTGRHHASMPGGWRKGVFLFFGVTIALATPTGEPQAAARAGDGNTRGTTGITPLVTLLARAQDPAAWQAFTRLLQMLPAAQRASVLQQLCQQAEKAVTLPLRASGLCPDPASGADVLAADGASSAAAAQEEGKAAARAITGALDLGASLSSGDTRERALSARIEARQGLGEHWRHELAVDGDWARRSGATSQQRLTGEHRLFYAFSKRATVFQFLRGEYDRFAGFDYRITESIGVGYDVVSTPRLTWHLEGGPGVRFIALADSPAMEQEPIARLSSELTWRLRPDWTLENRSSAFLGGEGNTLENRISLEARINSALFGRVSLHLRYDTKDLAGISKLDTLTRFSIGYRF